MADEPKAKLTFNQVGQSGDASAKPEPVQQDAGGGEQEGQEKPQYITKKDFDEGMERVLRAVQSRSDKTEARVRKTVEALAKQGLQATPEIAQAVIKAMPDMGDDDSAAEPSKPEPAQAQGKGAEDEPHPVIKVAQDIIAKAGLDVDKDFTEQEAEALSAVADPVDFLNMVKQVVAEKVAKRGTPARVPGINAGLGGAARTTMESLQKQFAEESRKPHPDIAKIRELAASMAKLQG